MPDQVLLVEGFHRSQKWVRLLRHVFALGPQQWDHQQIDTPLGFQRIRFRFEGHQEHLVAIDEVLSPVVIWF